MSHAPFIRSTIDVKLGQYDPDVPFKLLRGGRRFTLCTPWTEPLRMFPPTAMVNNDSSAQENIRNPLEVFRNPNEWNINENHGASLTSETAIQDVLFFSFENLLVLGLMMGYGGHTPICLQRFEYSSIE